MKLFIYFIISLITSTQILSALQLNKKYTIVVKGGSTLTNATLIEETELDITVQPSGAFLIGPKGSKQHITIEKDTIIDIRLTTPEFPVTVNQGLNNEKYNIFALSSGGYVSLGALNGVAPFGVLAYLSHEFRLFQYFQKQSMLLPNFHSGIGFLRIHSSFSNKISIQGFNLLFGPSWHYSLFKSKFAIRSSILAGYSFLNLKNEAVTADQRTTIFNTSIGLEYDIKRSIQVFMDAKYEYIYSESRLINSVIFALGSSYEI